MTQEEFIQQLKVAISCLPKEEAQDIIGDYQEYFREAKESQRTDADIIAALGSPLQIAREILNKGEGFSNQELLTPIFYTDEYSGSSWFKHAWHIFKLAPICWILLHMVFIGMGIIISDYASEYALLLTPFVESFFCTLCVALAWDLELRGKFSLLNAAVKIKTVFWRLAAMSGAWAILMSMGGLIACLIGGRPLSFADYSGISAAGEDLFTFLYVIIMSMFLIYTNALILINNNSAVQSYINSFKAGLKYWPQFISSSLVSIAWVLLLLFLIFIFFVIGEKIAGVDIHYSDVLNHSFFVIPIAAPFLVVFSLLSYTSWAAVFRDGAMKRSTD
jgi:uncharacterized membrane protein